MPRFGSSSSQPEKEAPKSVGSEVLTIIAVGATINGEIQSEGIVKVEGKVNGTVRAVRQVLVAKGGLIEGDVHTGEAIVGGEVHGAIFAEERAEVQDQAVVQGDISAKRLVVHEGGEVNGYLKMGAAPKPSESEAVPAQPDSRPQLGRKKATEFAT